MPDVLVEGGHALYRGRALVFEGAVAVSNGTLGLKASSCNVTFRHTLAVSGGKVAFPVRDSHDLVHRHHTHTARRNADRGEARVEGRFNLTGGSIEGNANVHLLARSDIRRGELRHDAFLINHDDMYLDGTTGLVIEHGGYLENRNTVEMINTNDDDDDDDDKAHAPADYRGILGRRPDVDAMNPTLQYDWEDNLLRNGRQLEDTQRMGE